MQTLNRIILLTKNFQNKMLQNISFCKSRCEVAVIVNFAQIKIWDFLIIWKQLLEVVSKTMRALIEEEETLVQVFSCEFF